MRDSSRHIATQKRTATFIILLAMVSVLTGCDRNEALRSPVHHHLVCPTGAEDGGLGCEKTERRRAVMDWLDRARRRPESTFTVWTFGGAEPAPVFTACVPASWGGNVMQMQARFIQTVRTKLFDVDRTDAGQVRIPETCTTPGGRTRGEHELILSEQMGPEAQQLREALSRRDDVEPIHQAVVCDWSNSTIGRACRPESIRKVYHVWAERAFMRPGSTFELYLAGRTRSGARRLWRARIPEGSVGRRVSMAFHRAHDLVSALPAERLKNASAIAEAIDLAADRLGERDGEKQLAVLSDMRQVSPRKWNFEREVPDRNAFVRWLRDRHLWADLSDVSVSVCGLHHRSGPGAGEYDAELAGRTRDAWESAFDEMGAPSIRIRTGCQSQAVADR